MRKTCVLLKQHIDRGFKRLWKIRSSRKILDDGIPASLEKFKHKIVEAVDFVKDPPPPKTGLSFPEPLALKKLKDPTLNADWHDEQVLLFDKKTKLIEGIPQILTLLKTVSYDGLPSTVQTLVGKMSLDNQDELLKRKIMQCNSWDGTQEKLPKKLDISKPGWVFPREYGIPIRKKTIDLENQILLLCALATSKHCTYLPRNKICDPVAQVFVEKEKERYLFSFKGTYSVMAKKPLEAFGFAEETETMSLPDIFPLRHTLDLTRINLYKDHETLIISPECRNPFVHTIGTSHSTNYYWHQPQKIVKGIATCFTFAVAQAHQLYGTNVKALQKPISIHGICADNTHYTIISYQLNTLNLDGSEGLKNQVWIDGPHQLFESCDEDQGVINYNPEVFPKILAAFSNGIL